MGYHDELSDCGYCGEEISLANARWSKQLLEYLCDECYDHLKDQETKGI